MFAAEMRPSVVSAYCAPLFLRGDKCKKLDFSASPEWYTEVGPDGSQQLVEVLRKLGIDGVFHALVEY